MYLSVPKIIPKTANVIAKALSVPLSLVCFSKELFVSLDDCRILMMARTKMTAMIIIEDIT